MKRSDLRRAALSLLLGFLTSISVVSAVLAADGKLIEAAKREGTVTWYTTLIVDQFAQPAADAFKRKYGIDVRFVRADPSVIGARILNEAQAGQVQADLFDGAGMPALERAGYVASWVPDSAKRLPAEFIDPKGYWTASNLYVMTPGYNTSLVRKEEVPRTYQDLLDPKWKGKLAWSSTPGPTGSRGFVGTVLAEYGEAKGMEYLQKLAAQQIVNVEASARQVLDLVIAGEYPIALQIFNNHAIISAQKGAPVNWIAMEPALTLLGVFQLTANGPHPNAGKLLFDFMISEEGQTLFRDADYLPVDPNIPPREPSLRPDTGHFRAKFFSPEQLEQGLPRWTEIYLRLFR